MACRTPKRRVGQIDPVIGVAEVLYSDHSISGALRLRLVSSQRRGRLSQIPWPLAGRRMENAGFGLQTLHKDKNSPWPTLGCGVT